MFSPAAVFFDLDGTLVDTEVLWLEAIRRAMAERGVELDQARSEKLVYGRSWADIYTEIDATWPGLWRGIDEMGPRTGEHFEQLEAESDVALPGSIALLRELAADHLVAIVSGSTNATIARYIEGLALRDEVRFHLGCECYSPGKPDPAPYLMAAERAQADPAACLVFEDSWAGVTSAKAAGMRCVALSRPSAPAQDVGAADLVLADLGRFRLDALAR